MDWRVFLKDKIYTVSPFDSVRKADEIMAEHSIRHLLVTDLGELKGVISDRDIFKVANKDSLGVTTYPKITVDAIMEAEIQSCDKNATVEDVCKLMLKNKFDCVPIIDSKKILGMITSLDIVQLVAEKTR